MADNLNITNIPAPRVPFIDERTGLMAREWYRFFLNLFVLTGSGGNPITLEELQLGPPNQQDFTEIIAQVANNLAPQYEDQSGDFLKTLDTAQLMSMMARFENLESAIQGAYLNPPQIPATGGEVVGPSSSTDNAIARFDGTSGKVIQNSVTTIDDTGNASGILSQQFSDGTAVALAAGKFWYNATDGSWNAGMGNGNITQQIGEEIFVYGKASAAITDSPLQIVYHTGVVGASGVITFAPTVAGITDVNAIIGVATESLALNGFGRATVFGVVRGITTNGTAFGEVWADDDVIWYNPVTGNPTKVEPVAPYIKVQVGLVIKAGAGGSGSFQVGIARGSKLGGTDSNVKFSALANNDLITYDTGVGYWKNTATGTGVVTALGVNTGTAGAFVVNGGALGTPSSGTVTNLTGTASININGTVGATTPTTGAFTTLSATNTSSTAPLTVIQDGTVAATINLYSYRASGNRAQFTGFSARGSLASPSDVLNDDSLIFLLGSAYAGGAFRNVVAIYLSVESTGTISATSCPTNITFLTTPNGSLTRAERMRIFSSGGVSIGNTTDPGATNLSVTGTTNVASTTDATSTTAAALITAGGLAVAKKVYTGDNVVPAAAKGVNFTGNTPASGMTSQLLNWYEEGTWTPVMTFSTPGDLAVTYSAQVGFYERIGSMVTAHFRVVASAFTYTTATGTFQITGLPFTSNSTTNYIGVGPVYINNVLMTAVSATATYPTARVTNGTSIINIIISGNNSAANTANQASMPSGNLVGFTGLVTYRV